MRVGEWESGTWDVGGRREERVGHRNELADRVNRRQNSTRLWISGIHFEARKEWDFDIAILSKIRMGMSNSHSPKNLYTNSSIRELLPGSRSHSPLVVH